MPEEDHRVGTGAPHPKFKRLCAMGRPDGHDAHHVRHLPAGSPDFPGENRGDNPDTLVSGRE